MNERSEKPSDANTTEKKKKVVKVNFDREDKSEFLLCEQTATQRKQRERIKQENKDMKKR